jgi:hypothetical protein
MNLDKRRSRLINAARLLVDAGNDQEQAASITLGAIGDLGLRSASPGRYVVALELFEQLACVTAAFDIREQQLGPWTSDVENRVVSPDWGDAERVLAEAINDKLDFLLDYGIQHGRLEVVPSQAFHFDALFSPVDRVFLDSLSKVLVAKAKDPKARS